MPSINQGLGIQRFSSALRKITPTCRPADKPEMAMQGSRWHGGTEVWGHSFAEKGQESWVIKEERSFTRETNKVDQWHDQKQKACNTPGLSRKRKKVKCVQSTEDEAGRKARGLTMKNIKGSAKKYGACCFGHKESSTVLEPWQLQEHICVLWWGRPWKDRERVFHQEICTTVQVKLWGPGLRQKTQAWKHGEGSETTQKVECQVPPTILWWVEERKGRRKTGLRAKAVLGSVIGNSRRGQAWGWGNDEPEEAEGEASKIRI